MKALRIATVLAVSALSPSAFADTFALDYENVESIDPAEGFEEDCLAETEAEDCPERAAALQAELVELLGTLDLMSDAESREIFQSVIALDDPRLQAMAVRYFAYRTSPPEDIWAKAREFFFGTEPVVGHPSAELLASSIEDADQELSRIYLEGRPSSSYGGELPSGTGETDSWALASSKEADLEAIEPFPEEDRYADARRLLMIDRFLPDPLSGDFTAEMPVTGFVADAPLADVEDHFRTVFGKDPFPPLATATERQTALLTELVELQERLVRGDTSVGARLEEVSLELQAVQETVAAGSRLSLDAMEAADHAFWVEAEGDFYSGPLTRAVIVGVDARLEQTVIRYVAGVGPAGEDNPSGGALGDGGSGEGATVGNGGRPGRGGSGGTTSRAGNGSGNESGEGDEGEDDADEDDGCGCSVPGERRPSAPAALLLLLAGAALQRRLARPRVRRHRSAS